MSSASTKEAYSAIDFCFGLLVLQVFVTDDFQRNVLLCVKPLNIDQTLKGSLLKR